MAFKVSARIDRSELDNLEKQIRIFDVRSRARIYDAVSNATKATGKSARSRIRNKTGTLKKRIRTRMDRNLAIGYVETKAPHSHLIEYGTQRHSLGKGIKRINGEPVTGDVIHPGSKPFPFMRPAYDQEAPKLIKDVKEILRK